MKRKEIVLAVIAIVCSLLFFIFSMIYDNKKAEELAEQNAMYGQWFDRDITDQEDVVGRDMSFEPKEIYVVITNPSLVYDNLTLNAIGSLRETCEDYLFTHGYEKARTLTIVEDSLWGDKSYFNFQCTIEEYPNTILNISYTLNDKKYELSIN